MTTIRIDTSSDAFEEDREAELARILKCLAKRLERGESPHSARDRNGNTVATVENRKADFHRDLRLGSTTIYVEGAEGHVDLELRDLDSTRRYINIVGRSRLSIDEVRSFAMELLDLCDALKDAPVRKP